MLATEAPFPQYFDTDGDPLDGGKLYFGLPNQDPETNPIPVYWDVDGTQPAAQPIRTMNGYTARAGTPANVFVDADYSINVRNKKGELIYYAASAAVLSNALALTLDLADTTDPTKGDAMVGVKQPYSGAVGRTQHAKNAETVSVLDFGADPTGATDSVAAFNAAAATGKRVYLPAGTYLASAFTPPHILFGDGPTRSIIKQVPGVTAAGTMFLDSGSASVRLTDYTFRDFQILGNVATGGYDQFKHQMSLNGVEGVLIENVHFVGFQGDGLYLGSGVTAGQERHNANVTVRKCLFDGVNNQNRNGISVIDVDGMLIDDNRFARCTTAPRPGPIDIEPDNNAFAIVRGIVVSNNVINGSCGGNARIGLYTPTLVAPVSGIVIENNKIYSATAVGTAISVVQNRNPSLAENGQGIRIVGNYADGLEFPFEITGVKGVDVDANTFNNFTGAARVGVFGDFRTIESCVRRNMLRRCGTASSGGLAVVFTQYLDIDGNTFVDCGNASGASIQFGAGTVTGTSAWVRITGNTFDNPSAVNSSAIKFFNHTFNPGTNHFKGNITSGNLVQFPAFSTDNTGDRQNTFTPSNLPADFPFGTSIAFMNAPPGGGLPAPYTQGMLRVEVYSFGTGADGLKKRFFIPRGSSGDQFVSSSITTDTAWGPWFKTTGV